MKKQRRLFSLVPVAALAVLAMAPLSLVLKSVFKLCDT